MFIILHSIIVIVDACDKVNCRGYLFLEVSTCATYVVGKLIGLLIIT